MGGGDYKEERESVSGVSLPLRWRFGPKLPSPPNHPRPYLYLVHNLSVGMLHPFPVRSPPQSLASLLHSLASSPPRLPCHCHSLLPPQPGFSSFPVSVDSDFIPCPPSLLHPSSIDLQISRPIPSDLSPGHPLRTEPSDGLAPCLPT
jgi:hypothetical protein